MGSLPDATWKNGYIDAPVNALVEKGLKDAATEKGALLSDDSAIEIRRAMTPDEYKNLRDETKTEEEKAKIVEDISDRVLRDPKIPKKIKDNIENTKKKIKEKIEEEKKTGCIPCPDGGNQA